MLKSLVCSLLSSLCMHAPDTRAMGHYQEYEALTALIANLEEEKVYAPGELSALFAQVARDERVLTLIARPPEKTREWHEYRPLFVSPERIRRGLAFWQTHEGALARAESIYGVPPEMIVAIIGVETTYGANKGRNRVIDALATLGFDYPPRSPFFSRELREFLVLAREEGLNPLEVRGSYAGALGFPQFMPSNWRLLAVDFDGDGQRDLIGNPVDAIGSVANYFRHHGWQPGQPVALRAALAENADLAGHATRELATLHTVGRLDDAGIRLPAGTLPAETPASVLRLLGSEGEEAWVTLGNYYVITRYNRSVLYAMAVFQLSEELRAARHTARANPP